MRVTLRVLLLALLVTSCAPVAGVITDLITRSDGATLSYVHQGLEFDPGEQVAVGVIVRAEGENLALLSTPDGATCTMVSGAQLDCRLGDVTEPVTIGLTGRGVVANASWRRSTGSSVYLVFAVPDQLEVEDE